MTRSVSLTIDLVLQVPLIMTIIWSVVYALLVAEIGILTVSVKHFYTTFNYFCPLLHI